MEYFRLWVNYLAQQEDSRIVTMLRIREKQQKKFQFMPENETHKPILDRNEEKFIFSDMTQWRSRYYSKKIKNSSQLHVSQLKPLIQDMSQKYIKIFIWT